MQDEVRGGSLHPMQAKKNLAWTITRDFHSKEEADAAADGWAKMFQQRGVSEDVPMVKVSLAEEGLMATAAEGGAAEIRVPKLLVLAGLASSTGEATRKLAENAVSLNGEKISGRTYSKEAMGASPTLRLGKKSVRVEWSD
jgi:tyrosyl-tRNA synthetase